MAQPHPPGIFDLQIDEEPVDVTWQAYHTTMTLLLSSNWRTEAWPVSREEFERTLAPSIAPLSDLAFRPDVPTTQERQ